MSFVLKRIVNDFTLYIRYLGANYQYNSTSFREQATTFTIFDDESVYNNDIGYVAIRNESTGRCISKIDNYEFDQEFIPLDVRFAWKFLDDGSIQWAGDPNYYMLNGNKIIWEKVFDTDPDQTGEFKIDDTSIVFNGVLSFDGVKNYKYINPRLEFVSEDSSKAFDFSCLIKFTPRRTDNGIMNILTFFASNNTYIRIYINQSRCEILFEEKLGPQKSTGFGVNAKETYELYFSSKSNILNIKLNGENLELNALDSESVIGASSYNPILLGAYVNVELPNGLLEERDFYDGTIEEFKLYNYFLDYNTIADKYEYGPWAVFDSNTNTVFKITSNLYSIIEPPKDYIIKSSGNVQYNISSSNGITLFTNFKVDNDKIFDVRSFNFQQFISGNLLSLYKNERGGYTFEYSRTGGLDVLFSHDFNMNSNSIYNAYIYITPSGKISGNFFTPENTGRYLFSTSETYTIFSNDNLYIYDKLVPETELFTYNYSGKTITNLSDGGVIRGEYLNLFLNRRLNVNKISSQTIGKSQPSLVYFGSEDGVMYEKIIRDKPYTHIRTVIEKSVPILINGNYVVEYFSNGMTNSMYEYSTKTTSTCLFNQIDMGTIAGHYGRLPVILGNSEFARVKYNNMESVIFKYDGSWRCRIYSTQDGSEGVEYMNRIYKLKFLELTNSVIVFGRASDVQTYFEDSTGEIFTMNFGFDYRAYIASINNNTGALNWIVRYSHTGGDINDMDIYQPDGTILVYPRAYYPQIIDNSLTQVSITSESSAIRINKEGYVINTLNIVDPVTYNFTCCFDDYGGYYIGGYTSTTGSGYIIQNSFINLGQGNQFLKRAYVIKLDSQGSARWSFYAYQSSPITFCTSCTSKGDKVITCIQAEGYENLQFRRYGLSGELIIETTYIPPYDNLSNNLTRVIVAVSNLEGFVQTWVGITNKSVQSFGTKTSTFSRIDDDGSFYICASSTDSSVYVFEANMTNPIEIVGGSSGEFSVLVKYDANGKIIWTHKFYEHINDYINDLKIRGSVLDVCVSYNSTFSETGNPNYGAKSIVYVINKNTGELVSSTFSEVSPLPGYDTPSIETAYWDVYGMGVKYANITTENSNVTVFTDGDTDYSKYRLRFTGDSKVYGIKTYIPEDSFNNIDDIQIRYINITPFQLDTKISSNISLKSETLLGTDFESWSRGEQSLSTLFDSETFGKGYQFINSYDSVLTPTTNITLDWTLYGSETINLQSTGEAKLYVDGNIAIDASGSNTCSPDQLHSCKLVYKQNTIGITYTSLSGISNAYALKPDSFIYDSNVYEYSKLFSVGGKSLKNSGQIHISGYGYNNKNVNITRIGTSDFINGLRWKLYDGFSFNDPEFYNTNSPFSNGITTNFNFDSLTFVYPFQSGVRFKIQDTETGNYLGLDENANIIETGLSTATTFETLNDATVYANESGNIALQAVEGTNHDNNYVKVVGVSLISSPFEALSSSFAWRFAQSSLNTFYILFDSNYYLSYNDEIVLINRIFPPRLWKIEFETSPVTTLTGGAYMMGNRANSVQWSGYFVADEGGNWEFTSTSNCFLTIGDKTIGKIYESDSVVVSLKNGESYPIRIEKGLLPGDDILEISYKRQSDDSYYRDWNGLLKYLNNQQSANLIIQTLSSNIYVNAFSVAGVSVPDGDYNIIMNSNNWNSNYFIIENFNSYVKLSNVSNIYYTKYSSGTLQTPVILNGNGVCFSDIVKYKGKLYTVPTSTVFTESGTYNINEGIYDILIVAGGGGGGGGGTSEVRSGGGGGGGGVLYLSNVSLTSQAYTIVVGTGGTGGGQDSRGVAGGNSSFGMFPAAVGGGGGGSAAIQNSTGGSGGSGGGSGGSAGGGGSGTTGQGYAGGNSTFFAAASGGGGAGSVGSDGSLAGGGNGGIGIINSLRNGTQEYYSGGGGGSSADFSVYLGPPSMYGGNGGLGGGGSGATGEVPFTTPIQGENATFYGGGGGGGFYSAKGGDGYQGIVIIKPSNFIISNIVNVNYSLEYSTQYDNPNGYELTLKRTPGVDSSNTYVYEPEFRSVLIESNVITSNITVINSNIAVNTSELSGGPSNFVRLVFDGNFVVKESGTYNVYPVYDSYSIGRNTLYDTNRMTYTVYGRTNISRITLDEGDIVPYTIDYYHTNNQESYADVKFEHVVSGNVYMVSGYTFADVFRTKISNFYRTTAIDANYDIIE